MSIVGAKTEPLNVQPQGPRIVLSYGVRQVTVADALYDELDQLRILDEVDVLREVSDELVLHGDF